MSTYCMPSEYANNLSKIKFSPQRNKRRSVDLQSWDFFLMEKYVLQKCLNRREKRQERGDEVVKNLSKNVIVRWKNFSHWDRTTSFEFNAKIVANKQKHNIHFRSCIPLVNSVSSDSFENKEVCICSLAWLSVQCLPHPENIIRKPKTTGIFFSG